MKKSYDDFSIHWLEKMRHLIYEMELHALIKGNVYIFYSFAMTFFGKSTYTLVYSIDYVVFILRS